MIRQPDRVQIAHLPTPIEPLPRLSELLGGPQLWVKRDDQTGLAFGGNKTRKLEYLLAAAQSQDADMLLTAGAPQSNHCRQTAAAAARFGMDCTLVLAGEQPPQASANILLDTILGAKIVWVEKAQRDVVLQQEYELAKQAGRRPYKVPYGGSSPTGAAAYAYAIDELQSQDLNPDWIVLATSSGGTQAGMLTGKALFNLDGQILGISVDEPAGILKERIADLAGECAALLGVDEELTPEDVMVNADYLGEGYAVMGEPEQEAIELFAHHEGLLLDPVYTGRATAGMIDLVRKGLFAANDVVLFWHTGGTPALFGDNYHRQLSS